MRFRANYVMLVLFVVGLIGILKTTTPFNNSPTVGILANDAVHKTTNLSEIVVTQTTIMTPNESCKPAEHVVFFKTHKTAGSSVQNMLMRYGTARDYMFVVPTWGNDIGMGYPRKFEKKLVRTLKPGYQYNILTHHTRFSRSGVASVMPADSLYFTILRNPVTLFESIYVYFDLGDWLKMPFEEFVSLDENADVAARNRRPHKGKIGRNQMSFDLGMDVVDFDDQERVETFAGQVEKEFDLVMIAERLPESLILMKNLLCWSTDDVVVFHHNARREEFKKKLTPELEQGILRWNRADRYLYDYFLKVFERKVVEFGVERMAKELAELEEATNKWYDVCVESSGGQTELKGQNAVYSSLVLGFKVKDTSNKVCQSLTKSELPFTEQIQIFMRRYWV